ncbi:MAG TPA: sigma-70 family RNA polymerase sigma factor [Thermoanaerobaculia bacterium]|nr:sigma-70 family RNA polymerase sigma factor [Thermoanaerobaculia bacterium]
MTGTSISTAPPQDLLPAVATGDIDAFAALYDRHSSILFGLLVRILNNREDAQEALQETFTQIWTRATMFDAARGSELAWVLSIARSRGIDRLRSRKIRSERESEAGQEISVISGGVEHRSGIDAAVASQTAVLVRTALAELPEPQRKALELAYFEGMSQSEIASSLGEPLGTIKTRMQLGMKKLRDGLRPLFNR